MNTEASSTTSGHGTATDGGEGLTSNASTSELPVQLLDIKVPGVIGTSEVLYAGVADSPLDAVRAMAAVESTECGAVVTFSGVVRNHDGGKAVSALSYYAHPTAGRVIAEVACDIAGRYDGVRIWVAHRIGSLQIGDPALVAAVASAHRAEAFAAASELADTVKERVPVWKEQHFEDGRTEWVGIGQ